MAGATVRKSTRFDRLPHIKLLSDCLMFVIIFYILLPPATLTLNGQAAFVNTEVSLACGGGWPCVQMYLSYIKKL